MQSKVSVKGQTVIPREIRKALGITPNTRLHWAVRDGVILAYPILQDAGRASRGILKGIGPSVAELLAERHQEQARERVKK